MVRLLEEFGVGSSIIAVGFLEAIAVSWFYGKKKKKKTRKREFLLLSISNMNW